MLRGGAAVLQRCQPFILLEVNPSRLIAAQSSAAELAEQCRQLGYTWYHANPTVARPVGVRETWNGLKGAIIDDIPVDGLMDVLCVPASRR